MSNQRPSFAKRDREMKLKDKAKAKLERRAARKLERDTRDTAPAEPTASETPAPAAAAVAARPGDV